MTILDAQGDPGDSVEVLKPLDLLEVSGFFLHEFKGGFRVSHVSGGWVAHGETRSQAIGEAKKKTASWGKQTMLDKIKYMEKFWK